MLSISNISWVHRGLLAAGLTALGAWLIAYFFVSDFDLIVLRTLRTSAITGATIVDTQYNPMGLVGFAVPVVTVFGGALLLAARPVLRRVRRWTQAPPDRVAAASEALGRELGNVLALVRGHLAASETHARSLANAQTRLSGLSEAQQVRVVVTLLVAENERIRRDSADFQNRIAARSREIVALEADLRGAQEAALQDPMTGAGNRRQFDRTMQEEIRDSRNQRTPLSLVMCDIDHFKRINDAFGHQVGDEIIKMLARVIRATVRETDTVIRYGGEEFAIILPRTTQDAARAIAERIRSQFEAKTFTVRETNQRIGQVTASFGVAQHRTGESVDGLVKRADAKLYEAKTAGRNRVVAASERN